MHVILITSVLQPINDRTIFPYEDRATQTIKTIETIRSKIPGGYIVMIEGGKINQYHAETFLNVVDYLFVTDVSHLTKSPGEGTLLYRYLTSDHFKLLGNVETVSKISGRYYLNDNFKWESLPLNKTIIAKVTKGWMGKPLYNTRYYRIPNKHLQNFVDGLHRYLTSNDAIKSWPDIEHCFYHHDIIVHDEIYCPKVLGVCGLLTGSNEFVQD